jgi:uncharacterized membrane protein (UPF0127 family)
VRALKVAAVALLLLAGCDGRADVDPVTGPDTTTASAEPCTEASEGEPTNSTITARASKLHTVTIETSGGAEVKVRVEIADDYFERARGLMHRTALGENRGMLFVYTNEDQPSFYMKNTLIPLSIAFMDSEGCIVDIQDMEPLDEETSHVSTKPAQYALEVNQGFFEERGVEVGDRADLPE